jgi:hypothetical protein
MMDSQRVDKLITILEEIKNTADNKIAAKLELDKCQRIIQKLSSFSSECAECNQHFIELEDHLIHLSNNINQLSEDELKIHNQIIGNISAHLQKQHKLITSGFYLSVYMSLGMSLGLVFGLLIFDNIALGLPLGMGIGVAIGAGLDEDAKKKGRTI